MSITVHDHIAWGLADSSLHEVEPVFQGKRPRRVIATANVMQLLKGPWLSPDQDVSDGDWQERCASIQADLDRFIYGKKVKVALDPRTDEDDCIFKRLDPIEDEVWAIRCRDPAPAVRVFGMFAETDIFVAFHWKLRKVLGYWGDPAWDSAIQEAKDGWALHFNGTEPKSGALNDYVRSNAIPV